MLALVEGGAPVAILAFSGNLASRNSVKQLPDMRHALVWYCGNM
jgi:hypothetical protein